MMVKMGDADGMVSGACHSTADTLTSLPADSEDQTGNQAGIRILPDGSSGLRSMASNGTFVFADCGLNQNPNPEELAAHRSIFCRELQDCWLAKEPIVAMLSHSTKGSAKHADVDKVVEATKTG